MVDPIISSPIALHVGIMWTDVSWLIFVEFGHFRGPTKDVDQFDPDTSMNYFKLWIKLGFPENGGFNIRQ